jgi:hypothetical protein
MSRIPVNQPRDRIPYGTARALAIYRMGFFPTLGQCEKGNQTWVSRIPYGTAAKPAEFSARDLPPVSADGC